MDKALHNFEKVIMYTLMVIGMMLVIYQTIYLLYEFWLTIRTTFDTGEFFVGGQGKAIGGIFFNILLTMEIVETVRVFNKEHKNKIQIILLVGLIAVTRKILLLDVIHAEPWLEISTSIMLIALGVGYYLVSRAIKPSEKKEAIKEPGL